MRRSRLWTLGAAMAVIGALSLTVLTPVRAAASATGGASKLTDGGGLHVVGQQTVDPRLLTVTVTTDALPGPANVRILLPTDYAAHPQQSYPVLYLLHGTSGGAADWTTMGHAEQTTAGLPLIVVMPDIALNGNGGGWCTNWPDGAYSWERFHIDQVIPWVQANLRTAPTRAERAIAGLSQGGFCSMSYAARHPDLFGTALSFSGAPDIASAEAISKSAIRATETWLDGVPANSMFGDRFTNKVNWAAHDPITLANNLRNTSLYEFFGNGLPGPLDTFLTIPDAIEGGVRLLNLGFHRRLTSLDIPSHYHYYGNGTHSWPYWTRDLRESIGGLMQNFAHPGPAPSTLTYTSAENSYSVYGWQVTTHRRAREFSTLENAACSGFALAGSGTATVTTPTCFTPGTRYQLTLTGDGAGSSTLVATAKANGSLVINVPLGPSNPYQQYTDQAQDDGTNVYTTKVSMTKL